MSRNDETETTTIETTTIEEAFTDLDIDASPDRVWEAITTDAGLSEWFGSGSTIDPSDGGAISTPDVVTGRPKVGVVTTVVPERQLDFTWWPTDAPDDRSSVSITLTPREHRSIGPATTIRVVETRQLPAATTLASAVYTPNSAAYAAISAWAWRGAVLCLASTPSRALA